MATNRTYSHLASLGRRPSDYEIASSRLLYYRPAGFEVATPIAGWYARYQEGSPLRCADWERFADPRETTYARYTALQAKKEIFVDALLESIERSGYDRALAPDSLEALERLLAPSRYPLHGFQMIASYIGSMAPAGRLTIVALFQAADEMRRIERIAYRVRQVQIAHPGFGARSRAVWEGDPVWQPLRECVEKLLVTYDWAEAFTGLNLCLKPLMDDLLTTHLASLAARSGDYRLGEILSSLAEDCLWHRQWSGGLVAMLLEEDEANREVLAGWIRAWAPSALAAVLAFVPVFERLGCPTGAGTVALRRGIAEDYARFLEHAGLASAAQAVETRF